LEHKHKQLDISIFYLLNIIIFIDLINGYFLNYDLHLPISQLYKTFLLFIIGYKYFFNSTFNIKTLKYILYFIFFLLYYIFFFNFDLFTETISHLSKFIFIVISYYYFRFGINSSPSFFFNKLLIFSKFSLLILCISLILGLFGFGFSTYGESSVGNKSFFNGANDLGVAIITLFSFLVYYLNLIKLNTLTKYLILIFISFLIFTISTKLTIIGTVLSFFLLPYIYKNKNIRVKKIKNFVTLLILISVGLSILYKIFIETEAYQRLITLYELHDDIGFLIFSGRQGYLEREIGGFFSSNYFHQIFGLGGGKTIELDFFDVLFNYGYFGLILIYGFYISLFISAIKKSRNVLYPFAPYVVFINLLLTFTSLLSGHVIFSAMGGIFISLVNSLTFYKTSNE
jgi:hypothetical protein